MSFYLGIDAGTTKVAAVVVDSATGREVALKEVPNDTEITSAADNAQGRSEWDVKGTAERTLACASAAVKASGIYEISGIGVTGQMHGMALIAANGEPVSPFIGWQDQRCQELLPGRDLNYIDRMMQLGGVGGLAGTGCLPATGYMASTLFWLALNGDKRVSKDSEISASDAVTACFLPDYIVLQLTGKGPFTDPTNAAGGGVADVISGKWNTTLISKLGLRQQVFPPILKSCSVVGGLASPAARKLGLKEGIPVCVACGDNQAGFAGSVANPPDSILVNIGTGAQVSAWAPGYISAENLDVRPHIDGNFLIVGAPLCGGASYAYLRDFFVDIGRTFFGASGNDVYAEMTQLASTVPSGAEGLKCEPLFTGTRLDPKRRASWSGISRSNFTPAHFARAVLEGIAEQCRLYYADMLTSGMKTRKTLVCSGNGVRRNKLLSEILADTFHMSHCSTLCTAEAAFGAALVATVGAGEFSTLKEAATLVKYCS